MKSATKGCQLSDSSPAKMLTLKDSFGSLFVLIEYSYAYIPSNSSRESIAVFF